jgi:hypothetical protein
VIGSLPFRWKALGFLGGFYGDKGAGDTNLEKPDESRGRDGILRPLSSRKSLSRPSLRVCGDTQQKRWKSDLPIWTVRKRGRCQIADYLKSIETTTYEAKKHAKRFPLSLDAER